MDTSGDSGPRAIFFDVGETLIRPRRSYDKLLEEVAQQAGIELPAGVGDGLAARLDARIAERTRHMLPFTFPEAESQRFWWETYYGFLAQSLSRPDANLVAHALLRLLSSPAGYELFDDAMETLVHLRNRGYRLGIISNWEAWLPTLLETAGIAHLFDHVIISGVCGMEKPDVRIFTLALNQGSYRPEEVVYVGDRPPHDVEPARSVGIQPILLDRDRRYRHNFHGQRISSLHELPLVFG